MTVGRAIVFASSSPLAKRYLLAEDGKLTKTTAAQMTRGTFRTVSFSSAGELAALMESVGTSEALCASLPVNGSEAGRVVTQAALADSGGALARTKQHFRLLSAPGLLFLDSDDGSMPRDDLWRLLVDLVPALAEAGVVWRPSGSSHICRGAEDLTGCKGQHLLAMIADASDGPRVVKTLAQRLWLAGHGRVEVSKAGSLLMRCPIDTAPADAARLIFAGGAIADPPLEQRRGPAVILSGGAFLDSRALVPDLTAEEEARLDVVVEKAKAAKMAEAMQRRAEHRAEVITKRLPEVMRTGATAAEAEARIGAAVDAAYGGSLLADFELTVVRDDGTQEVVTVADVLADRLRWNASDCLDPLNPGHRGGSPDCRLYLLGTSPIAYSLDGGGVVYRLRSARQRLTVSKGTRSELVKQLCDVAASLDCLFRTDTGPVIVNDEGRPSPLTIEALMNLIGSQCELVTIPKAGVMVPTDLQRETAQLVLSALKT